MYCSFGANNARGVAILFNKHIDVQPILCFQDHDGRMIGIKITVNNCEYLIVNIYAPNNDEPEIFTKWIKNIEDYPCENVILGGDFNLTMNPNLDIHDPLLNNYNSMEVLQEYMERTNLVDIWRVRNLEMR